MTPEQYQQIQNEFLRLREMPAKEQAAQLSQLNIDLRDQVASLLDSENRSDGFLTAGSPQRRRSFLSENGLTEHDTSAEQEAKGSSDSPTRNFTYDNLDTHKQVGRYRLLQRIGEGGQGAVYMAQQQEPIRRKVAVKLIKPGMDSAQVLARFQAEQQALAMMDHPSIARVLDAGATESGAPYFVMELVKGVPINDFCDRNSASLEERLQLFQQVCSAVHHAHGKGIIHRDIKPSNVLVTMGESEPIAKVIDFGIAKALNARLTEQTLYTEYGQMIGTLEYMSPEQAEMSAVEIDTRSDVYSLGVLLYQLLTGQPPISRDQLLKNGLYEIPRLLRETELKTPSDQITGRSRLVTRVDRDEKIAGLPNLPRGDLDWITLKALAKDRRRRYDSVLDLNRDVQRFQDREPVHAHPPSTWYRASKLLRRYRVAAFVTSIVMLGTLLGILGLASGLVQAKRATLKAETERNSAIEAREAGNRSARELAENVYSELIQSAWREVNQQDHRRATELLDKCMPELRGWEWNLVQSQIRDPAGLSGRPPGDSAVREIRLCPRRDWAACTLENGDLEVWDVAKSKMLQRLSLADRVSCACWDPEGDTLFVGCSSGSVAAIRSTDWTVLSEHRQSLGGVYDIQMSPTQSQLAVCTGGGWVKLFDLKSLTGEQTEWNVLGKWRIVSRLASLAFTTDASKLVGAGFDGHAYVMENGSDDVDKVRIAGSGLFCIVPLGERSVAMLTGDAVVTLDTNEDKPDRFLPTAAVASALAVDDTGRLAIGCGDGKVLIQESVDPQSFEVIAQYGSAVKDLAWHQPTQGFLVALSDGRTVRTQPRTQSPAWNKPEYEDCTTGIVLSKHALLVMLDGNGWMHSFDLESGTLKTKRRAHKKLVWEVSANREQTVLATVGEDQRLCCWSLPDFEPILKQPIAWGVRDVCLAPDGSWVAAAPGPDPDNYPQEGTVAIWNTTTGDCQRLLVGHENWVIRMAVTDDGKSLATSGENRNTRLWDVQTGEERLKISHDDNSAAPEMAFDSADQVIYLGHRNGWVTAWDTSDGSALMKWQAFGDAISGLAATKDGRVLATSRSSPRLKVYDPKNERTQADLDMGQGRLLKSRLSQDDRVISFAAENRRIVIKKLNLP